MNGLMLRVALLAARAASLRHSYVAPQCCTCNRPLSRVQGEVNAVIELTCVRAHPDVTS